MGSPGAKLLPVGWVTLTRWTVGKIVIMGVGVSHPYGWNLSVGVGESHLGYTTYSQSSDQIHMGKIPQPKYEQDEEGGNLARWWTTSPWKPGQRTPRSPGSKEHTERGSLNKAPACLLSLEQDSW